MTDSTATSVWTGDLARGTAEVSLDTSGLGTFPYSLPARAEAQQGQTNPEELLAASHSACYAMQLSALLSEAGTPPEKLEASATVTLVQEGGGFTVSASAITVRGTVPGVDADAFASAAEKAKEICPISRALAGVASITLDASLAS